ncbi:ATP-grasp domain-containing protein [Gordonia alkaliphila]|uniref:ATP-grasp domain-containing protein n=1 Tax=Gordonia alkaliphila TaxID=1053547 RepID=UPI001FF5DE02|nr:ATP-grasp domain-containing protein [Gordonia alkaliphila]MCK0438564.1 ATP-grasp domain-containing protein [Gordonia alkaliphila]
MAADTPRILATSARMPFAVDEIHKLGEEIGHSVIATDTFKQSPGMHSKGADEAIVTRPPTQDPDGFVEDVIAIIDEHKVDWVLPMFEEVFYLAANRTKVQGDRDVTLFYPELDALLEVNDKSTFAELCKRLELPLAETIVCTTPEEFVAATQRWEHWFGRATFGRGGLDVITNTGPLAGETAVEDIKPTEQDPWLVQEFLVGTDRCSWSIVHEGEVVLHATYEHPLAIDDRGGIVFASVDSPESLAATQKIAKELNWTGQISMDYLVTEDGTHYMVECNPRPTAGCTIATAEELDTALFRPDGLVVVPAGRKKMIKAAVLRDALLHPSRAKSDFAAAKGAKGVYDQRKDHMPLIYSALSLRHVLAYRKALGIERNKEQLVAAQFFDILYDGSPLS